MIRTPILSVAAALAVAASLAAQGSVTPRFRYERTIETTIAGPQRLDIDAPLLAGAKPFTTMSRGARSIAGGGLGDLRLFTAANEEVPYLLIPPPEDAPVFMEGRVLQIAAVDTPTERSSGFEVDLGAPWTVNALSLAAIRGTFLKRFALEGSGDRERWTQLVAEGTAFNLPEEKLAHTLIEFEAGSYRYLRVTWNDTNSARVAAPDTAAARRVTISSPGPALRVPIAIERRPSEPRRSRFRLTLPAAGLPIAALELTIGGGHLSRLAWILEAGLVGDEAQPRSVGRGRLVRIVRDQVNADALRIPIERPPSEPQLELVVDDGDNPPLALEAVTAVMAELPWIYFEAPAGPITARYGDPRLTAPRYDLEAARESLGLVLAQPSWRPQPPVTLAPEPEGLPMPDTGSALRLDGFAYVRDIPAGAAGLIAVPLDAAATAHSVTSPRQFTDVRVVDRNGFQVPYLLEKRDGPLVVDTALERRELPAGVTGPAGRVSSYFVRVPYQELPNSRLVLTTQARVFTRPVTLGMVAKATERQPIRFVPRTTVTWTHQNAEIAAPPLTFELPDTIDFDLFVLVEEGDNQPLPIEKATILLPSYAVRLFRRPDLPLRLVYGQRSLDAPRYDLQLLAPQVMGRLAEEVAAGPEMPLNGRTAADRVEMVPPVVFWSALGLAVLVLLGMVVRLMRAEPA